MSESTNRSYYLLTLIAAMLSVLCLCACSGPTPPENYEPTFELLETTDINRTEATISARIHKRGSTNLTHLSFHYGEYGNISSQVDLSEPDLQLQTYRLQGLKPGTSYSWYIEGHTTTATLRSEIISFTTVPNELPTVSPIAALSTGPVGIIVSFDITDDGGEPLLEAGCEVTDNSTSTTTRLYLPDENLSTGSHRMYIGSLDIETNYTFTPFASNPLGESKGISIDFTTRNSIMLTEAGSLPHLFEGTASIELEQLTISGYMNGDDFKFLRLLLGAPLLPDEHYIESKVSKIDLSDADIVEGGASYDGSRFTTDNQISTGLLADCINLRDIILPNTAATLARDAFSRCSSLEYLTISSDTKSVLPSAGCTCLKSIRVSDANTHFTAIDGVLFNSDATEIIWFPLGKTGNYSLPPTITRIGENAFFGTGITGLEIPPSVTSIGRGAFAGSSLTEISLPDNITNISEGMFQNCTLLTTLRLGKATEFIGNFVFDGTDIKNLYVSAPIPPFTSEDAFFNLTSSITENCVLHVPYGCKAVYRNHPDWGNFSVIEEF